ncbi:MAG: PEGA domain-containing protein [Spirochaetes bacterium]|nr:PEGA domain-containing protein [Spirochaetota bacterium]
MYRKILSVIIILCSVAAFASADDKEISTAILPIDDSITSTGEIEKAGSTATALLEDAISANSRFFVRKSDAISEFLKRLELLQAGIIDDKEFKDDSDKLKVNCLTVGTLSKFESLYEIDIRTVNIDTWKIVHSQGCSRQNIGKAVEDIAWYYDNKFTKQYLTERESTLIDNPTVSVFIFEDYDTKTQRPGYGEAFSEILNSQLGSFMLLTTVERKFSKSLIDEKAFQMTGVTTNDDSNNNFSIRDIQYKISGDVRIFDDLICINYKVFNTADGRLIYMNSNEINSMKGLRKTAWEISSTIEDVLKNRIGTLEIKTKPENAIITINSAPFGNSPQTLSLAKGQHLLRVSMEGYRTHTETITIEPQKILSRTITLEPVKTLQLENAYSFEKKGKWDEAVNAYKEFIDQYYDSTESNFALYRQGHVQLMYLKQYDRALQTFQTLVSRYPETMIRAEGYIGIAKAQKKLGNDAEAKKTLDYLIENYGETNAAAEARKVSW